MKPPFPRVVDSSLIAAFRSCHRKAELDFFLHYKSKEPSVHLHAGAAYAHGLEAARRAYYEEGRSADAAVSLGVGKLLEAYGDFECPEDSPKSATRMAGALEFYFSRYPLETDDATPIILPSGKRGIEFSFSEPIDIAHPETGDPILYCGRMDMVVNKSGMVLGEDDKTTSQLGATWPKQWDLRSQFTGYTWGALRGGVKLDGFLVRGVSILKSKYDTAEAITYRPAWQIDRWYAQLLRDVKEMIRCWEEGYWDYNLDHACAEYGGCQYRQVCLAREPAPILAAFYQRRRWDPVTREETILED